jgi:hypothetical protein
VVDHNVKAFSHDSCLIGGGAERRFNPVAVVRPVDGQRRNASREQK